MSGMQAVATVDNSYVNLFVMSNIETQVKPIKLPACGRQNRRVLSSRVCLDNPLHLRRPSPRNFPDSTDIKSEPQESQSFTGGSSL
jgi:hypothetical protein